MTAIYVHIPEYRRQGGPWADRHHINTTPAVLRHLYRSLRVGFDPADARLRVRMLAIVTAHDELGRVA